MKTFILTLSIVAIVAFAFIGEASTSAQNNQYNLKVEDKPGNWVDQGSWMFGGRPVLELKLATMDGKTKTAEGKTFMGQVKYDQKEGMRGLKLQHKGGGNYSAQTKLGLEDWKDAGTWKLGNFTPDRLAAIQLKSTDGGKTLTGTYNATGYAKAGNLKATLL